MNQDNNNDNNKKKKQQLVNVLSMVTVVLCSILVCYVLSTVIHDCMTTGSDSSSELISSNFSDTLSSSCSNSISSPNTVTITREFILTPNSITT